MVKLAALLNANSSNYSPRLLRKVSEMVGEVNGKRMEKLGLCRPTYNEFSINRDVEELAKLEPEYLLLGGGDGSLLFYLRRMKEVYGEGKLPKMIYLPIGRENRLGYELGYHKKPMKFLEEVIEDIIRRQEGYEEMSLIEARVDERKVIPTFELGFGLITNILLRYYGMEPERVRKDDDFRNMAYRRKKSDSFKTFLGAFFNAFRYWTKAAKRYFGGEMVEIKTEEESFGRDYWLGGLVSTNKHVWKGFKTMYRGREDPEKMHLLVTTLPPFLIALKLLTLYKGRPIGGNTIDEVVKKSEMVFERPTIIQMAGEFFMAEKVELEIGKKRICFVKAREKRKGR